MKRYKLLVLTDHSRHSEENSIYPLLRAMRQHKRCQKVDVASRGLAINHLFFEKMTARSLWVTPVVQTFSFSDDGLAFRKGLQQVYLQTYDAVLLRLPHPITTGFWEFLGEAFPGTPFINSLRGGRQTESKAFLLNFPELCPPMRLCACTADIEALRSWGSIVLKPVNGYGGSGILRLQGDRVLLAEGGEMPYSHWSEQYAQCPVPYLAVQFLPNVTKGDKRIVVCCGEMLGAALRTPAKGQWMCNVSRGGSYSISSPDADEIDIIAAINPILRSLGVVFYGVDTLENDRGKRALSEINTLSIGGLHAMRNANGVPAIKRAGDLLWDYIHEQGT